ncbi:MAG: mechanosensitive ion channel [Chloracidobacterium sp.]|nr:mechanosensitive ion channel [Chloracidobacterium sp.]
MKKVLFAYLFLAVCMSGSGVRAQNQTPQTEQSPSETTPQGTATPEPTPTPIPISDIVTQAENARSTLKEIEASVSSDPMTDTIERDLPRLTNEINARIEETANRVKGATSLDTISGFESDWRSLTENLPEWKDSLNVRAKNLEDDLQRIVELNGKGQRTLEELKTIGAPPEVMARIQEIIRASTQIHRSIVMQQAHVIALQNRVAEQQSRVDESLKTIRAKRQALVGQLLTQDSPPIWGAALWGQADALSGVKESIAAQFETLNKFISRNQDRLILQVLIFVALAGFLFYLRRKAHLQMGSDSKNAAVIFDFPISTALVLAIMFTSRIYPQTPQILSAIFGAVALVPTVIILRKLVERSLYPLLYSLFVLYFFDKLRLIAEPAPALARPLFLVEMICAFLFFCWFYLTRFMRKAPTAEEGGHSGRALRVASILIPPFFAAAFLLNAFGYVNLARLIGDAVLRSAYAAVIFYAVVRILDGLVALLLKTRRLNRLKMVREYASTIQGKALKFIRLVAFAWWLSLSLKAFNLRGPLFRAARAALTEKLTLGALNISAGDVLLFFAVVWAAFLLSRFIRFALEEDVYPRLTLDHGIPYAISTIVNYLILLLGFFFAVSAAGFDLTRLTVLLGAFGVGIGFGLQNIFSNFISGLILLFERPVNIGDEIKIGESSGVVRRIGIRASRIKQWDNSEIIVPNSKLISETVKNGSFTLQKRGIEIPVSVAHGVDVNVVINLLTDVARSNPLVAEKPAPQVILSEIVSPSLNLKLRVWTSHAEEGIRLTGELAVAISQRLAENNVVISTVQTASAP